VVRMNTPLPCSAVRIFTSSFSSVAYSSLPCSCSRFASNFADVI